MNGLLSVMDSEENQNLRLTPASQWAASLSTKNVETAIAKIEVLAVVKKRVIRLRIEELR